MGFYKYVKQLWKRPKDNAGYRPLLLKCRKQGSLLKIDRPTRIDRARHIGYKAKEDVIVIRCKVKCGGRKRPQIKKGRRSKHAGRNKVVDISYQRIAENRVLRKYTNCRLIGSYWLVDDSVHKWYEVVLKVVN